MAKFYTKKGWLTAYGLACGYIETVDSDRYTVELFVSGGIHVRAYDHEEKYRISWDCYDTISEARKAFSALCRELKVKRVIPAPSQRA